MLEFPEFKEKCKVGKLEFEIMDLSVRFIDSVERNPELYCDNEILKDGSTLTDEEILTLGSRTRYEIVQKILDITNPDRHKKSEGEEGKKQ